MAFILAACEPFVVRRWSVLVGEHQLMTGSLGRPHATVALCPGDQVLQRAEDSAGSKHFCHVPPASADRRKSANWADVISPAATSKSRYFAVLRPRHFLDGNFARRVDEDHLRLLACPCRNLNALIGRIPGKKATAAIRTTPRVIFCRARHV